jgi:phage baseplate assembly protein W
MPIPVVTKVDLRDLDKNRAVGIPLPFNGKGVFNKTFQTKDQVKSNIINLLLTSKGERPLNPEFGSDLPKSLFEPLDTITITQIQNQIINSISTYIPEVVLTDKNGNTDITITPDIERNTIYITISYFLKLSGVKDTLIIDFSTLQ